MNQPFDSLVLPRTRNRLAFLFVYDTKQNSSGFKLPKDSDNHLCDALRYAFEDVKFFKPSQKEDRQSDSEISHNDFNGGWDL